MIRTKLMAHQERITAFGAKRSAAAIFSDYGTGKSLCALAIAEKTKCQRILIISTRLSVLSTWPDEIMKHTDFRHVLLVGQRKHKLQQLQYGLALAQRQHGNYWDDPGKVVVFLINYEGLRNVFRELSAVKWDMMVCDESTKIKSVKSLRTRTTWALGKRCTRKYIMTGFPITENLSEIYAQMKFLGKSETLASSHHAFMNTFFVRMGTSHVPKKQSVKDIIARIKEYTIRVTNESLDLPPKMYRQISVDLTPEQEKALQSLTETFRLELGKVVIDTQHIFTLVTKSLQICDGFVQDSEKHMAAIPTNKDEALLEILDAINVSRHKVVIWCAFRYSIAKIKRILNKLGIPTLELTGSVKNESQIVKKFQHSKTHNVILATQKKAAESITLTSARYAIYYSNVWSFDLRGNSEARICRKGSERHASIMYIDLVTKSKVEQNVYACLRKKKNLIEELKRAFRELGGGNDVIV